MKRKRFALLIGIASAVIPMMPVGYYCFFAFVRNEHFYRGFPTSYWERAIKRWKTQVPIQVAGFPYIAAALNLLTLQDEPAVLEADDDAGPVLVDLFRSETAEVRRAAVLHLADTRLHGEETAFGEIAQEAYALNLPASYCNQVMLVLVNWRQLDFDPYTDDLVLIDGRGRLLDHLSCSIENPAN